MRVLLAIGLLGFACRGLAYAADLPVGSFGGEFNQGQRSEMVWLYDNQPGVVVRSYWSAPWHDHHYFPYSGIRPRVGRYENLSAVSHPSKPAKSYRRSWSNNWAFERAQSVGLQPLVIQGDSRPDSSSDTGHRPLAPDLHGSQTH